MAIKAVLFDLGETLFNYGRVKVNHLFRQGGLLTYDFLKKIAPSNQLPRFDRYYWPHLITIRRHYLCSLITNREFDCSALLNKKAQQLRIKLTQPQLDELTYLWYKPLGDCASIEPDLPKTLEALQTMGLKLSVVSNTFLPAATLDRHLRHFDILRFFPVRVYSSETIYRKPHRRIYQSALDKLQVAPDEAIMVGDKLREDVKGPGKLGIKGIFKRGQVNIAQKVPADVAVINRIAELPELIQKTYNDSSIHSWS
jgi:putative hydrolase of the HAD superfamily